jgi:hypothetical protein
MGGVYTAAEVYNKKQAVLLGMTTNYVINSEPG